MKLVGYVFIGISILGPLWIAYTRQSAAKKRSWVKVKGQVVVCRVEFHSEDYEPIVAYTYRHDGREYRGDNIRWPLLVYNFSGPAKRVCARYPLGAEVDVHIDPSDPSRSLLEPGSDPWLLRLLIPVSLVLLILGIALAAA